MHGRNGPMRTSVPTPFVPSGHFPLIGGIGPYRCAVAEIGIGIQMVRSKTVTWVMTSRSKSEPTM